MSTYQAGKLFVVGAHQGALALSFHNFEHAMGVAARRDRIAVGTRNQVWSLRAAPDIAPRLEPAGRHDGCFLARSSHFTGDIDAHELAWAGEELWVVNTLFSCLCTLHEDYSFVPRWRPPFVSALAAEDRCHLNGLAISEGRPRYVTALAETDTPEGWRPDKATGGCLIDVPTGATVARGFAMPHSPRVHRGRVWLLDSGTGRLVAVDPATGGVEPVAELPGYRARPGVPRVAGLRGPVAGSARRPPSAACRSRTGASGCGAGSRSSTWARAGIVAHLEFLSGVEEIFAVQVLPGIRFPAVSGPYPEVDGVPTIWSAPDPGSGTRGIAGTSTGGRKRRWANRPAIGPGDEPPPGPGPLSALIHNQVSTRQSPTKRIHR